MLMKKVNKSKYKKVIILLWIFFLIPIISSAILFKLISDGKMGFMPSIEDLANPKTNLATEIYSSDKVLMGKYFKENRLNINYNNLSPNLVNALIATEDVRYLEHSGIDFYSLGRVIFKTIIGRNKNAGGGSTITQQLAKMLFTGKPSRSITERVKQKLKEWVIAVKLEKHYTKEEIIALYFNKFDFLNLAVGIKTASTVYFNTTPDSLTLEQAAMLVGMAKNPSKYNPLRFPERTKNRRETVLDQMVKYNYIAPELRDSINELSLGINFQKVDHKLGSGTYFREYLRQQLTKREPIKENYYSYTQYKIDSVKWIEDPLYGWCNKNKKPDSTSYNIYSDGLKIHTTINYKMQHYAELAVSNHLNKDLQIEFFKEHKNRKNAPFAWDFPKKKIKTSLVSAMKRTDRYRRLKKQGYSQDSIDVVFNTPVAMKVYTPYGEVDSIMSPMDSIRYYKHFLHSGFMSMEPQTGYVRAYVGGLNFKHFQYDHVTLGKRQVGSTFKPFLYTLAMQEGYSPCHEVPLVPVVIDLPNGETWSPRNSDKSDKEGEMVSLQWGIANSNNYITAWVMKQFNPFAVIEVARKMGIKSSMDPVPSICLGTPDISLYEMVGAFSTFANKGVYVQPIFVTRIEDKNGNVLQIFKPKVNEAISENTAHLMVHLLRGVVLQGSGSRLRRKYDLTNDIGGKTGTTQNQSDGWFIGITPDLVSGTWVGCEDRAVHFAGIKLGQGANMALPIWAIYMQQVYADSTLGYSNKTKFERPAGFNTNLDCDEYNENNNDNSDFNNEEFNFNK